MKLHPAIAAFLRQFGVPVLSMSTLTSEQAVGRMQVRGAYASSRVVFGVSPSRVFRRDA